jgi:hypothetical protein
MPKPTDFRWDRLGEAVRNKMTTQSRDQEYSDKGSPHQHAFNNQKSLQTSWSRTGPATRESFPDSERVEILDHSQKRYMVHKF